MKKVALSILSVFMLLGGVILSACGGEKPTLSLSTNYVEIYTNDEDAPNSKYAKIEVALSNSKDGIGVQVESGSDVVTYSTSSTNSTSYTVTLTAIKSGSAKVKVYARADKSVYDYIDVAVKTLPTSTSIKDQNDSEGKTSLFVVKGGQGTSLAVDKYISFEPADVNVLDVAWSFDPKEVVTEAYQGDALSMAIIDGKLFVYEAYAGTIGSVVKVYAIVNNNEELSQEIDFQVIEDSTINDFRVGGQTLMNENEEVKLTLVRNNAQNSEGLAPSAITGVLDVETFDEDMTLSLEVTTKSGEKVDEREYFAFSYTSSYDENIDTLKFVFNIDALYTDSSLEKLFGELNVDFVVSYSEYAYQINANEQVATDLILNLTFVPTSIVVRDGAGNDVGGNNVDLYSQYYGSQGYLVYSNVYPDDVPLQNSKYRIRVDIGNYGGNDVGDFLSVVNRSTGTPIEFSKASGSNTTYVSDEIENGTQIYLKSGNLGGLSSISNFQIHFEACGNLAVARTTLTANLYNINMGASMNVEEVFFDGDEMITSPNYDDVKYISSARNVSGVADDEVYYFKISGISSTQGLSVEMVNNRNFAISMEQFSHSAEIGNQYVIVRVTVSLNDVEFNDSTSFHFTHKSGLNSKNVTLEAFCPLTSTAILNNSKGSNSVYEESTEGQNYFLSNGKIESAGAVDNSLSSLLVSAGSNVNLLFDNKNATLDVSNFANGFQLAFLEEGNVELEGLEFNDLSTSNLVEIYNANSNSFSTGASNNFAFLNGRLYVENAEFVAYIMVQFFGFDNDHNEVTLVRFFRLEGFYPVTSLRSNNSNVELISSESLSGEDEELSTLSVRLTLRSDDNPATYADLSHFKVILGSGTSYVVNDDAEQSGTLRTNDFENMISLDKISYIYNDYLILTNFRVVNNELRFDITAESTKFQSFVNEIVQIRYQFKNTTLPELIDVRIEQVDRVESVKWMNGDDDSQIYLNVASDDHNDQVYTITTSVGPSTAYNKELAYYYHPLDKRQDVIRITTSSIGQTFTLSVRENGRGGWGYLYLLPADMIKYEGGVQSALTYTLVDGEYVAEYLPLADINSWYQDVINGTNGYLDYFVNVDDEKVYYKDIIIQISITVADGKSEETAIRIYSAEDFEKVIENPDLYYRIMNDITLENWQEISDFKGMIFGNTGNETIKISGDSFVNNLSGVIKDLNFQGDVDGGAFVAKMVGGENINIDSYTRPTIDNVTVDVQFVDGKYAPSTLTGEVPYSGQNYSGVITAVNAGQILNSKVLGVTINSENADYLGGIAGYSFGLIDGASVEFYNFVDGPNKFTSGGYAGGIVGYFGASGSSATIRNSYVYAFNLDYDTTVSVTGADKVNYNLVISAQNVSAIAGYVNRNDVGVTSRNVIETSFAFLGNLDELCPDNANVSILNSYITYYQVSGDMLYPHFAFYNENGGRGDLDYSGLASTDSWSLQGTVWEIENIDEEFNFGFPYLKNVKKTPTVSVEQTIQTVKGKSLQVSGGESGILYHYSVKELNLSGLESGELNAKNIISLGELFGVSNLEAESLLISVDDYRYASFSNISLSTNRVTGSSNGDFATITLTLTSRTDFSVSKNFEVMILSAIPTFTTAFNGTEIRNNQIINIQTGTANMKSVEILLDNSIYLHGNKFTLNTDNYEYYNEFLNNYNEAGEEYFSYTINGNHMMLEAERASGAEYVSASISLGVKNLTSQEFTDYQNAIKENHTRTISLSAYDGANSLIVDTTSLSMKPLEAQSFSASLNSDSLNDKINLQFVYEGEVFDVEYTDGVNGSVVICENLKIDVSVIDNGNLNFTVLLSVNKDYRHKVDADYNLEVYVRPESQKTNDKFLKIVKLLVQKQTIEEVYIANYMVTGKQFRVSTWYYNKADRLTSTIMPGTETIVAVEVNPNFAHMTHFKLTYTLSNTQTGTISLSRLYYNSNYGYYVNSQTTETLNGTTERGLIVHPTDTDLRTGTYYFRLYVSSSFTANSTITLNFTFYDGEEVLKTETNTYSINYVQEAEVRVNGEATTILAKGDTAEVEVDVNADQTLERIYLLGHGNAITLTDSEIIDNGSYLTYRAYINTSVLSNLATGAETGAFTVEASVVGYVNGKATYKYSYATVYLVDFTVETDNVSIKSSDATRNYDGAQHDAFVSYINATGELSFDYNILPEEYNYNSANVEEANKVSELISKRNKFLSDGYYEDKNNNYYINYSYNTQTGTYSKLSLRDRLYYVGSDGSETPIYNSQQGRFITNSTFEFSGGEGGNSIKVKGLQSGIVHLRLKNTMVIAGRTINWKDYDFVVAIEVWTDEETPIPIYNAEEFLKYASGNADDDGNVSAGDYILMNDIVLSNHTPISTEFFNSLDGNGFTIFLNSFNMSTASTEINLALFSEVTSNSTIKNVRVNIYNGGQIKLNINNFDRINIAGFTLSNDGIIYNCDVVAYYDVNKSLSSLSGATGLVVTFVKGSGGQAVNLTSGDISPDNINIAGFVLENNNTITNSRVGGETYGVIKEEFSERYYDEIDLPIFTVEGQGYVSGFAGENTGTISASFVSNAQINNKMRTTLSATAGFVRRNSGNINTSYVKGNYIPSPEDGIYYYAGSTIMATGKVGGFVYSNSGTVKNSYVNFAIETNETRSYLSAGFVYENDSNGAVSLCFSQVKMADTNVTYINNMSFSGANERGDSLNQGDISYCYYYCDERNIDIQNKYNVGAYAITRVNAEDVFYHFSFSSEEGALDGIWTMNKVTGITLASADHIAFSNRYIVYDENNEEEYSLFYSTLRDYTTKVQVDLSYGSLRNPIIIKNAEDFAKATGKATEVEVSSYKKYYNDNEVFGHYRFVSDINFDSIDQNLDDDNDIKLTTTSKDFSGILDGNGFTIQNMILESLESAENYGLFARIDEGSVVNLGLEVASVHNGNANIVGTLAGTVIDSRLVGITLSLADSKDDEDALVAISIHGNNIVGGLAGTVFGDSKISDVTISDIDVAANYYDVTKRVVFQGFGGDGGIVTPNENAGETLRGIIELGGSISSSVSSLSYAGGLAGYVDIYAYVGEEPKTYKGSVDYADYDISTIRILNSINIYGEVAGGMVGYLSETTVGYDMGIELNADMGLSNPSYITAKNLYAGGIAGESYGGIFASYAEYSRDLQDSIEENEYAYYNGAETVERGQTSIFSYTAEENTASINRHNDPYFVGGLVGFAGGGYISTSYNRLNVVSNVSSRAENNVYFGGIVGAVSADFYYSSLVMQARSQVSYFLNETYFSGVLNVSATSSAKAGGAIGFISADSIVGLKNVNTMPYYENNASNKGKLYGLIGGFETVKTDQSTTIMFPTHLYLLDNLNGHYDVITSGVVEGGESPTTSIAVSALYLAVNHDIEANPSTRYNYIYGFTDSLINNYVEDKVSSNIGSDRIMQVEWIKDLSTMEVAYTKMNQYFLRNDWDPNYWEHEANTLYPRIVLTPRTNVIFLDAYEESIRQVLSAIATNSSLTVVVRGMREPDNPSAGYSDVDLTGVYKDGTAKVTNGAVNFSGRFVSYEEYMKSNDAGVIESWDYVVTDGGYVVGGVVGDNAGLILDKPLFENVDYGFVMSGLNLYYKNTGSISQDAGYTSLLVSRTATNGTFSNLDIHIDSSLILQADTYGMAGLLTAESVSSDFMNINLIFMREGEVTANHADITFKDSSAQNLTGGTQYFGILAGRMVQNSVYKAMTISNINFVAEEKYNIRNNSGGEIQDSTININFVRENPNAYTLYFGLLAGESDIAQRANISTFKMTSLNRYLENEYTINIDLDENGNSQTALTEAYIGSYFGKAKFTYIEGVLSDEGYPLNNINLTQGLDVVDEYLGLGFGVVSGNGTMSVSTNVQTDVAFTVRGNLKQEGSVLGNANIGGLIGQAEVNEIIIDDEVDSEVKITIPNNISSGSNLNVGSFIGSLTGSFKADAFNSLNTFEVIEESTSFNVRELNYGFIGLLTGHGSVTVKEQKNSDQVMRSQDKVTVINASKDTDVNIGGLIGKVSVNTNNETSAVSANVISIESYVNMSTYTLRNNKRFVFGGVIGNSGSALLSIKKSGFGGQVNVEEADDDTEVTVGGVIGSLGNLGNKSIITNGVSFGDVLVGYKNDSDALNVYNFGGMVGYYQANEEETEPRLKIEHSYSLMTSFNTRIRRNEDYNAGAIVGYGSGKVEFTDNYYSANVTFVLQTEEGNSDTYYIGEGGKNPGYYGYYVALDVPQASVDIVGEILRYARKVVSDANGNIDEGTKLNPIRLDAQNLSEKSGKLNNSGDSLNWFYIDGALGGGDDYVTERIANLNNAVIVGNGQTVNFKSNEESTKVGENIEGNDFGFVENMSTELDSFSAISGLIVNNTVSVVAGGDNAVGGIVGATGANGTAMFYAVGATGTITVGGKGNPTVSGIAGHIAGEGLINNAYFDGDIYYSAGASGNVNGIAYAGRKLSVYNTFSAGAVQTLSGVNDLSLFTNAGSNDNVLIKDCYTIMQHISLGSFGAGITNTDSVKNYTGTTEGEWFIDGSGEKFETHSVGYGGKEFYKYSFEVDREEDTPDPDSGYVDDDPNTLDPWFYSPYNNYGYATTAFGFLRNITVYHRDAILTGTGGTTGDETADADNTGETTVNYNYRQYSIDEVIAIDESADYFYPILNSYMFDEMMELSGREDDEIKECDRQYMLRYTISASEINRGEDFDKVRDGKQFTLDGRNNTLSFAGATAGPVFNTIYGNLENLKFVDVNVKMDKSGYTISQSGQENTSDEMEVFGTLAYVSYGATIKNVSMQGSIESDSSYQIVGGVVGIAVDSTLFAVESVVDFNLTQEQNSIVGGVVGYAFGNGKISYCSNAGNIEVENSFARGTWNEAPSPIDYIEGGNRLISLSKAGENGLQSGDYVQIRVNNAGNGGSSGGNQNGLSPSSILGGVVGYTEMPIDHSFNTASIINGYKQFEASNSNTDAPYRVGHVVSGGVAGYSTNVITNSFNTGYIVSGNMYNYCINDEVFIGYAALAGGVVGFLYGEHTDAKVIDCYNDGKVQAVSYLDKSEENISVTIYGQVVSKSDNQVVSKSDNKYMLYKDGKINAESDNNIEAFQNAINSAKKDGHPDANVNITITTTIEYNTRMFQEDRCSFAYALGYTDSGTVSGKNGKNAEIVNDGNIGIIHSEVAKKYTVRRYAGIELEESYAQYGLINRISNLPNDSVDFGDVVISGYDSYGFPSRLNIYYDYTFDMRISDVFSVRDGGSSKFWEVGAGNKMKITINDPTPYLNSTNQINVYGAEYAGGDASPGGTTQRYISIPFYSNVNNGYNGGSYEEYVYRLNKERSLYNTDEEVECYSNIDGELGELYGEIREVVSDNSTEKRFDVCGTTYSMVYNAGQLEAYTKGIDFSGSFVIDEMPTLTKGGETLQHSSVRVSSMDFTLKYNGDDSLLKPLSYSSYVTYGGDAGGYKVNYVVYYDRDEISEWLTNNKLMGDDATGNMDGVSIGINYDAEFTFNDNITLSKNNVVREGNKVTFKYPNANTLKAESFGEYLEELGVGELQENRFKVDFGDSIDKTLIASLLGDDGSYYITYDMATGDAYAEFDTEKQAEDFTSAIDGTAMTVYYYVVGSGNFEEDESLLTEVVSSITPPEDKTYNLNVGEFIGDIKGNENAGAYDFTSNDGTTILTATFDDGGKVITLNYDGASGLGGVKIDLEGWGSIYYYPNSDNSYTADLNTGGAGVTVEKVANENKLVIRCDNNAYEDFKLAVQRAIVSYAQKSTSGSIDVPRYIDQVLNDNITIRFALDTNKSGYDFNFSDNTVTVSALNGSTTFEAEYLYDSLLVSETGNVQYFSNGNKVMSVKNEFNLSKNVGENVGIKDNRGATYHFSAGDTGESDIWGETGSYTLTAITDGSLNINVYKFADAEIWEYNSTYAEITRGNSTTYHVRTLASTGDEYKEETLSAPLDKKYFYPTSTGDSIFAGAEFSTISKGADILTVYGQSNLVDKDEFYLVYELAVDESEEGDESTTVGQMILYPLNGEILKMTITSTAQGDQSASFEKYVGSIDGWFNSAPNYYFVAESYAKTEMEGALFDIATITFDEDLLKNVIDLFSEYSDMVFEVTEYGKTLSENGEQVILHYGTESVNYTPSTNASWDTSSTSSTFNVSDDGTYTVTLRDAYEENENSTVEFGVHSGSVVFKGTVKSATETNISSDVLKGKVDALTTAGNISNIILAGDIFYEGNIGLEGAKLYGNGHILNLFGDMSVWKNMIEVENGGLIDNTTFVFIVSLGDFAYQGDDVTPIESDTNDYDASLIYLSNGDGEIGEVTNLRLYGALRNISSDTTLTSNSGEVENANIIESARNADGVGSIRIRDVYLINSEQGATQTETGETENALIISKMTLQGASAQANESAVGGADLDGANVRTRINVGDNVDASKTYVVLGDGANGANGNDGSSTGSSGYNGGNGGKAGQVGSIGYEDGETNSKTAQVFYGFDGVGGNGGNGADGKNASGRDVGELSQGGGGGGAYGLDGAYYTLNTTNDPGAISYDENAYSTRLLSNRRQASETEENKMLDGTYRSALGGSGGSGGLGYIYYNEVAEDISDAYNRNNIGSNGGRKGPTYYYGNGEDINTYYVTAGGGGSAGIRRLNDDEINVGQTGNYGDFGRLFAANTPTDANGIGRGERKLRHIYTFPAIVVITDYKDSMYILFVKYKKDENTKAYYSYYWSDHHIQYANEFLFGNLQYIPAFSHWYTGVSNEEYQTVYTDAYEGEGGKGTLGRMTESPNYTAMEKYLTNYINYNSIDGNTWRNLFVGGLGGHFEDDTIIKDSEGKLTYLFLVGGTPYTKEIYGYTISTSTIIGRNDYLGGIPISEDVYDQYFFSRNDMVTSGGYYGTAQGLSSPARTALA